MAVKIRIYGKEATFSQGVWHCEDTSLEAMLEALSDPRATSSEQEYKHALYAAGRYGGLIATDNGWEAAPLPAPEIRMEDFQSKPKQPKANKQTKGGFFGLFRRKR